VRGIWVGLTVALIVIGSGLVLVWARRLHQLHSTLV
jgi:hypothetical protein